MIGFERKFGPTAREINLTLNAIDKTQLFNQVATKIDGEVALISGRWVLDGKSLMGMYSLDLSKEIRVVVECETAEASEAAVDLLRKTFA